MVSGLKELTLTLFNQDSTYYVIWKKINNGITKDIREKKFSKMSEAEEYFEEIAINIVTHI